MNAGASTFSEDATLKGWRYMKANDDGIGGLNGGDDDYSAH
jgi:hypothetical protein